MGEDWKQVKSCNPVITEIENMINYFSFTFLVGSQKGGNYAMIKVK